MEQFNSNILVGLFLLALINLSFGVPWERLRCAPDTQQAMPEGIVDDIGRFPWLGIVQHSFYIAGKTQYAITGAVLIHPAFAVAPAEDMAKIIHEQLVNNTKLILWESKTEKYALDVKDYILHPQYENQVTFSTIALLDLVAWGEAESPWQAPVLPICMPVKGFGTYTNLYTVLMSDVSGQMQKEIVQMNYMESQDCEEFYYKKQLSYEKINPVNPLCAVSANNKKPCVWDSGAVLITRQSWGYWKLLGFAIKGPGCGAPTRFLNIHDYLPWINDIITNIPLEDYERTYKIGLRRVSPIQLVMYKADVKMPNKYGQCDRKIRGTIQYKDSSEILVNKNFAQGFFFVVITQLAEFLCAEINLQVNSRTNAALWLEHNFHRHHMGLARGQDRIGDPTRATCFLYYKTTAFLEFRFYFSFRATIDAALFGKEEHIKKLPNPFMSTVHTTNWWPTPDRLRLYHFTPVHTWWHGL